MNTTTRGIWLCVNSPYRNVVINRVQELAGHAGAGIHFDYKHNPPAGCYCTWCEAKWEAQTGQDFTFITQEELWDFYVQSVKDYFVDLTEAARAVNPEFIIGVKAAEFAAIWRRALRTANAAAADIFMLEFAQGIKHPVYANCGDPPGLPLYEPSWSTKWAVAWGLTRDATYGRPPKIAVDNLAGLDAEQTFALTGAALTFGATALLVYPDLTNPATAAQVLSAHLLGAALARTIGHTRPVRWVGILFPESALVYRNWNRSGNPSNQAMQIIYREIFSPIFGAVEVFRENGAPYGFISEEQLLEYASNPAYLSAFAQIIVPVAEDEVQNQYPQLRDALDLFTGDVIYLDGRFPVAQGGNGNGDRWDGYPGFSHAGRTTRRDQLKRTLWGTVVSKDPNGRPPIWVDKTLGSDGTELTSQVLRRPGARETLVMLSRRWDWAAPGLGACAIPRPAGPASGYRVLIPTEPVLLPAAYEIDLVTGARTALAVMFDGTVHSWYVVVPEFEQLSAIVIED